MPGGDGTGPAGQGPRTGRGAGFCAGFNAPGYANLGPRRGYGRGRGRGFGRGRGWGRGRGRGWGWGSPVYAEPIPIQPVAPAQPQMTKEQEITELENESKMVEQEQQDLKAELDDIKKRIEELKKKK